MLSQRIPRFAKAKHFAASPKRRSTLPRPCLTLRSHASASHFEAFPKLHISELLITSASLFNAKPILHNTMPRLCHTLPELHIHDLAMTSPDLSTPTRNDAAQYHHCVFPGFADTSQCTTKAKLYAVIHCYAFAIHCIALHYRTMPMLRKSMPNFD